MKYSESFNRDYNWYLKWKDTFNFDGAIEYSTPSGDNLIKYSKIGKDAKMVFYLYDSVKGKKNVIECFEPDLLYQIMKCKGSINFNIKMWAEDRYKGYLPATLFEEIVSEYELLHWMVEAVNKQTQKYRMETMKY